MEVSLVPVVGVAIVHAALGRQQGAYQLGDEVAQRFVEVGFACACKGGLLQPCRQKEMSAGPSQIKSGTPDPPSYIV